MKDIYKPVTPPPVFDPSKMGPAVEASRIWSLVSDQVREVLGDAIYEQWIEDIIPLYIKGDEILLEVPGNFHKLWIDNNYSDSVNLLLSLQRANLKAKVVTPQDPLDRSDTVMTH